MASAPAAASLLRLTSRDRMLVTLLAELRYLTVHQVRQACFPTLSPRAASQRLSLLRGRGVLDCLRHRTFDDRRAFWGLGALGRAAAAALSDGIPVRPSSAAVGALLMDHLVATNQIFCDLCGARRAGRLGPFSWVGSQHAHVDLGLTHLVPDAMIIVPGRGGERWLYCLERDRGTMSADALADKFARYRLMHERAREHAGDPAVGRPRRFVAHDRLRRRAAGGAGRRVAADAGLGRVWAGLAPDCAASLAAAVESPRRLGLPSTRRVLGPPARGRRGCALPAGAPGGPAPEWEIRHEALGARPRWSCRSPPARWSCRPRAAGCSPDARARRSCWGRLGRRTPPGAACRRSPPRPGPNGPRREGSRRRVRFCSACGPALRDGCISAKSSCRGTCSCSVLRGPGRPRARSRPTFCCGTRPGRASS